MQAAIYLTKVNLGHWKVLDSPTYKACRMEAESSGHLFWHCGKTRDVWTLFEIPLDLNGVHFHEFIDLLWHLKFVQHVGNDILELVITFAWSILFNRNQVLPGKTRQTASMIIQKARSLINESQVANFWPPKLAVKDMDLWIKPKPPWYKINIDGVVFAQ